MLECRFGYRVRKFFGEHQSTCSDPGCDTNVSKVVTKVKS